MRSASTADLTAKAQIRGTALRLFAEDGFDAVSVRRIATEAGVSPALVLHHFASKQGLRQAVDDHVVSTLDNLLPSPDDDEVVATLRGQDDSGIRALSALIAADSPVLPYLRRMLLTDDQAARQLVRHWHSMMVELLGEWAERGLLDPGPDPAVRAALLLSADLGVVLLRGALTDALGFDPLDPEGIRRWSADAYALTSLMLTSEAADTHDGTSSTDLTSSTRGGTR